MAQDLTFIQPYSESLMKQWEIIGIKDAIMSRRDLQLQHQSFH